MVEGERGGLGGDGDRRGEEEERRLGSHARRLCLYTVRSRPPLARLPPHCSPRRQPRSGGAESRAGPRSRGSPHRARPQAAPRAARRRPGRPLAAPARRLSGNCWPGAPRAGCPPSPSLVLGRPAPGDDPSAPRRSAPGHRTMRRAVAAWLLLGLSLGVPQLGRGEEAAAGPGWTGAGMCGNPLGLARRGAGGGPGAGRGCVRPGSARRKCSPSARV